MICGLTEKPVEGIKEMFRVSYLQNGTLDNAKIKADKVAHKTFKTQEEALKWVVNNSRITPLKLLIWDDETDCYVPYASLMTLDRKEVRT